MENKIKIQEIAPYLPYGIELQYLDYRAKLLGLANGWHGIVCFTDKIHKTPIKNVKPILYRLPCLHDGEDYESGLAKIFNLTFKDRIAMGVLGAYNNTGEIEYRYVQKFLSLHIDVFNLIPRGLAIDINTLNK